MRIPRLHLFELEDQAWFPSVIRDLATDYLHFMEMRFVLHRPAVEPIAEALRCSNTSNIVDLCSGGGGSMPALVDELAELGTETTVVLTDLFPNSAAFEQLAIASEGKIQFHADAVDAREVPAKLCGLRTMFNS